MGGPSTRDLLGVPRAEPAGGAGAPRRDDPHRRARSAWTRPRLPRRARTRRARRPDRPRPVRSRRAGAADRPTSSASVPEPASSTASWSGPAATRSSPSRSSPRRARLTARAAAAATPGRRAGPGRGRLGRGPGAPARRVRCRGADRRRAARVGLPTCRRRPCAPPCARSSIGGSSSRAGGADDRTCVPPRPAPRGHPR